MFTYFKMIAGVGSGSYIYYWKSRRLSDKRINSVKASNHSNTPNLHYYGTKTRVEFNGSWKNSKHLHSLWDKWKH